MISNCGGGDINNSDLFYDEYTLLEACIDGDLESLQNILDDNPTNDELNERDPGGKVILRGKHSYSY